MWLWLQQRLHPHPSLGVLLWLQYLRYSSLASHHELLWHRHWLLQVINATLLQRAIAQTKSRAIARFFIVLNRQQVVGLSSLREIRESPLRKCMGHNST